MAIVALWVRASYSPRHPVTESPRHFAPVVRFTHPTVWLLLVVAVAATPVAGAGEPPALNPFAPVKRDRDDAIPGYVEMSDGQIFTGNIYMTRDKRLKLYDESMQRQREIPLRVVDQIECNVVKEWMEKEWRFKEMGNDEKYFTGREYPSREYTHTVTLKDGREITGPLGEIVYVRAFSHSPDAPLSEGSRQEARRLLLHKRDKGEVGEDLESVTFVKLIKLGSEALEEGRRKAATYRPTPRQ